jgi:hypothetical protein
MSGTLETWAEVRGIDLDRERDLSYAENVRAGAELIDNRRDTMIARIDRALAKRADALGIKALRGRAAREATKQEHRDHRLSVTRCRGPWRGINHWRAVCSCGAWAGAVEPSQRIADQDVTHERKHIFRGLSERLVHSPTAEVKIAA